MLAKQFGAETGIRVEGESVGYDVMIQRATLDLTSRTGRYDIVLQAPESWGRFAAQGLLHPISDFSSNPHLKDPRFDPNHDLFDKPWHELGWYGDTAYGYPFATLTMNVWYRKDLLDNPIERAKFQRKYGYELVVPRTWREYRDVAEFFTRPAEGFYGTCLQAKRHPSLWQEWLNFAYSFGGGTLQREHGWQYGPIIINSPESVEATKYYKDLLRFSPPGTLEYTWDDAQAAIQQGKVFMAFMWTDACAAVEDPKQSKVAGKMAFTPPPAGRAGVVSQISGASYLIPKSAKSPEAAYLFVEWLLQPHNQVTYQLSGGQSGYHAVYQDARVRQIPYTDGVYQTIRAGIAMRETIPEAAAIGEAIQVGLSDIMNSRKSPEAGLNWTAMEMKRILGDKAELKYPPLLPSR
jgi:multiple sugar transport system substrate-binding protein